MNEPRNFTEAINQLRSALLSLDWTDQVFGRAALHYRQGIGQTREQPLPMAYAGAGEYIDCRPNDAYKSVLFFAATDRERNEFSRAEGKGHTAGHIIRPSRAFALIGWVNLDALPDWDDQSGFAERIKLDLKAKLKTVGCVAAIGDYIDTPINEVFRPFLVTDLNTKFDRMPFCVFRLELVLQCVESRQLPAALPVPPAPAPEPQPISQD